MCYYCLNQYCRDKDTRPTCGVQQSHFLYEIHSFFNGHIQIMALQYSAVWYNCFPTNTTIVKINIVVNCCLCWLELLRQSAEGKPRWDRFNKQQKLHRFLAGLLGYIIFQVISSLRTSPHKHPVLKGGANNSPRAFTMTPQQKTAIFQSPQAPICLSNQQRQPRNNLLSASQQHWTSVCHCGD